MDRKQIIWAAGVWVMASGWHAAGQTAETPWREPPRIDQCRVVYAYEPGTELAQAPDGTVLLTREVHVAHDECRARYAKRALPFEHVRAIGPDQPVSCHPAFEGVDTRGQAWFLEAWSGLRVQWGRSGRFEARKLAERGHDPVASVPSCLPNWPWVGANALCQPDGTAYVLGCQGVFRLSDRQTRKLSVPPPDDANALNWPFFHPLGSYWTQRIYDLDGAYQGVISAGEIGYLTDVKVLCSILVEYVSG